MFLVNSIKADNSLELKGASNHSIAKICLDKGGSLQKLHLNDTIIINNLPLTTYKYSYASAILFPFASRIEQGIYSFRGEKYQLYKNDKINNCALHGLIYNKTFTLLQKQATKECASATLVYIADGLQQGFPFKYKIKITYILTDASLKMEILIKNLDEKSFPFAIGWHPYFFSEDLNNSYISFKTKKQAVFSENLILEEFIDVEKQIQLYIKDTQLDNCYKLQENNVYFTTPNYKVKITPNSNFLQLYTPKNRKHLAIEPITAPSNSFNNKIGLQVLESKQEYNMTWKIKLIDKDI